MDFLIAANEPNNNFNIVGGVLGGFSVALLAGLAKRGKPRLDTLTRESVYRHSKFLLVVGIGGLFLAVLVPVLMFTSKDRPANLYLAISCTLGFFVFLSAYLLWEYSNFEIRVSADGIDCRSPWKKSKFIVWSDIRSFSYSRMGQCFTVRDHEGWKFSFGTIIPGIRELIGEFEHRLDVELLKGAEAGYKVIERVPPWLDDDPDIESDLE